MDPITMASIGAIIASSGAGISLFGKSKQDRAQQNMVAAQNEAAALARQAKRVRAQQAALIFQKQQRDIIRNAQVARSVALTRAENQGAGTSSTLGGALGQIAGQEGSQLGDLRGNYALGQRMFGINANISQAQQNYANAQASAQGAQGIMDFGKTLFGVGTSVMGSAVPASQAINTFLRPPGSDMGLNSWSGGTTVSYG